MNMNIGNWKLGDNGRDGPPDHPWPLAICVSRGLPDGPEAPPYHCFAINLICAYLLKLLRLTKR